MAVVAARQRGNAVAHQAVDGAVVRLHPDMPDLALDLLRLAGDRRLQQAHEKLVEAVVVLVGGSRAACHDQRRGDEIGRASCRARVCPYVWFSVVAGSLKKK